jgi:hypothetical protein
MHDTLADMPETNLSLAEETQTWKAFSEEWAKVGDQIPGVGRG